MFLNLPHPHAHGIISFIHPFINDTHTLHCCTRYHRTDHTSISFDDHHSLLQFLDGLYLMLSDKDKDIRREADNLLAEFLREIQRSQLDLNYGSMISILLPHCASDGTKR